MALTINNLPQKIKIILVFLLFVPFLVFAQSKKFFNKGKVEITNSIEKIPLNFVNDMAIVKVEIEGKYYNFIFDTGAPLIISNEVYERLKLKTNKESDIIDANNNKRKQKFTTLPSMKTGGITFKNFGAIVIDFEDPAFKCYNITGMLGANQMAKLFWKIDYQNNSIEATEDLKNFNPEKYKYRTLFTPLPQKTPKIFIQLQNENKEVNFDTGFAGSIILTEPQIDLKNPTIAENLIKKQGSSSVGMFGIGENSENYIFKTNEFSIDNIPKSKQIIQTGEMALIGNTFLKNYVFILDWKKNEILFKEANFIPVDFESFGFSYRFADGKVKVVEVFKDQNIPVKIGDEILSINDENVENLNEDEACKHYFKSKQKDKTSLKLKIKRGDEILNFTVNKQNFFKN